MDLGYSAAAPGWLQTWCCNCSRAYMDEAGLSSDAPPRADRPWDLATRWHDLL